MAREYQAPNPKYVAKAKEMFGKEWTDCTREEKDRARRQMQRDRHRKTEVKIAESKPKPVAKEKPPRKEIATTFTMTDIIGEQIARKIKQTLGGK